MPETPESALITLGANWPPFEKWRAPMMRINTAAEYVALVGHNGYQARPQERPVELGLQDDAWQTYRQTLARLSGNNDEVRALVTLGEYAMPALMPSAFALPPLRLRYPDGGDNSLYDLSLALQQHTSGRAHLQIVDDIPFYQSTDRQWTVPALLDYQQDSETIPLIMPVLLHRYEQPTFTQENVPFLLSTLDLLKNFYLPISVKYDNSWKPITRRLSLSQWIQAYRKNQPDERIKPVFFPDAIDDEFTTITITCRNSGTTRIDGQAEVRWPKAASAWSTWSAEMFIREVYAAAIRQAIFVSHQTVAAWLREAYEEVGHVPITGTNARLALHTPMFALAAFMETIQQYYPNPESNV